MKFGKAVLLALCLVSSMTGAQPLAGDSASGRWAQLSPSQQRALAPLSREWDQLPGDSQRKWLEIAQRFHTLPTDQQTRVQQRMTEWAGLTPAQRGEARVNFQESRQVPAQDRQAQWEAYRALPPEQRQALAAKAQKPDATASSPARNAAQALRASPLAAQSPKENLVPSTPRGVTTSKAVAPTLVQSPAGATTALVTAVATPPAHQQAGKAKVIADAEHVNRTTLLPRASPSKPSASAPASAGHPSSSAETSAPQ